MTASLVGSPRPGVACSGVDESLTTLRRLLDEHADEIVDEGTVWVRAESQADLASRPYGETRILVAQCLDFYRAQIFTGDTAPREAFIDVVTSNRSNLKFSVSTLLRGFLSFRVAVVRLCERMSVAPEQALEIMRLVDGVSAEAAFRTADLYVAKLNRVLDATREELIRKDKLAALGGLVAGVAHEINTPLGVAVTAASLVGDRVRDVLAAFADGTLRRQDLQSGLGQAQEAARLTLGNLRRAAELVGNFKQIAVDQASEARRCVDLGPYVREVVTSLGPLYRRTPHRVLVDIKAEAMVTTLVGAVSQVCTNLIQNALMHAFPDGEAGTITFEVDRDDGRGARLVCRDDGVGMEPQVLRRIYEPFFTTQRALLRTRQPVLRRSYNIFGIFHVLRDEDSWAAVFMEGLGELSPWDQRLIELFCQNASVALENHRLSRRQTALMQAFARFVPQRLLSLLGRSDATQADLGDQIQREMTVVFVDLRAFTSRAEQQSPAATFEYLNTYFAAIVPEIHGNGGVVDKYLGDGLMALFPDTAASAVRAALGVVERSRELGAGVGVGVHVGPVTLGLVGAAGRMESTVVSDAVNIAARIERLTRRFGADLLISGTVRDQLPPTLQADTRPLGSYVVPGKRLPVQVHEVFAGDPSELRAAKRASRAAVVAAVARMTAGELAAAATELGALAAACPNDQVLPGLVEECRRREGRA